MKIFLIVVIGAVLLTSGAVLAKTIEKKEYAKKELLRKESYSNVPEFEN